MAKLWKLQGSPLLIVILLLLPFLVLALTGNVNFRLSFNSLSTFAASSVAFDSASTITSGWGSSCGGTVPNQPCPNFPVRQTSTAFPGGGQTFNIATSQLVGQAPQGICTQGFLGSLQCGGGYAVLGNLPGGGPSVYGLSGSLIGYPFNLLGLDTNFINSFGEQPPSPLASTAVNASSSCALTLVANACNPYTIILTSVSGSNQTQTAFNVYRFEFVLKLQTFGSALTTSVTQCTTGIGGTGEQCTNVEVQALNNALSFINGNNKLHGNILVDIAIPDVFTLTSPQDKWGIVGAWIAGGLNPSSGNGCLPSSTALKGIIQVSPCGPHALVTNTKLPFTPPATEPVLTSYSQLPGALISNGQLQISVNSIGTNYNAVCIPTNCSQSQASDCLSLNYCTVQSDPNELSIQIPIVLDVWATGANLQLQAKNIGLIVSSFPISLPQLGSIKVHVQDAVIGWPIAAIQVGLGTGGSCGTTNNVATTDGGGNANIFSLNPGSYTVCAAGGSGQLTLFFFTLQLLYSQNSGTCNVVAAAVCSLTIPLQPNLLGSFTIISVILLILAVVVIFVWIFLRGATFTGPGRARLKVPGSKK